MANLQRNFIKGRMNKSLDERLLPNGEYIDALNVRLGSTEDTEIGSVENSKGNTVLTQLSYSGADTSLSARCIGAFEDGANQRIYWFVHDPAFTLGLPQKLDLIVSYNIHTSNLTYHVISINDGSDTKTTLNFSSDSLITGINLVEDLLFFTDNLNPPRAININKNYDVPVNNIDQITAEELLVIKRPPVEAPTIRLLNVPDQQDNFLEERFISFAYRYRYSNGEYSATSQFSKYAFDPGTFNFSFNSFLNEGMKNSKNAVIITFNAGGPLVQDIQLLFKESTTSNIKVIETFNKSNLGYADFNNYTFTFDDSKIFTLLPESEILRLYDNVPKVAQSQTVMGNRLMYGNYKEGYDLKDKFNDPIKLEYIANLNSEVIDVEDLNSTVGPYFYTINGTVVVNNPVVFLDLSTVVLKKGAVISLDFRVEHEAFSGNTPGATTIQTELIFEYTLPSDFANVYSLATSTDFIEKIGTATNIQTVPNACNGTTLTDQLNCALPSTLGSYTKTASGITADGQPISIVSTPGSNTIGLVMIAMKYVDSSNTAYEYYNVSFSSAVYQGTSNTLSLHSNRGYEIGMVYMDEYGRSSTALVSPSNTVQIPCANSINQNKIQATIPIQQLAPSWATRYKFVIKPSEDTYDTIYSNIYYKQTGTNFVWFLLEGESANKIQEGDRLIVKSDSQGPVLRCVETSVLEKTAQALDFLPDLVDDGGNEVKAVAGTYMKLNPSNFSTKKTDNSIVAPGTEYTARNASGAYPILAYPMNVEDPANPGEYIDYDVPAGTRITINIRQERLGPGKGNGACERRINQIDVNLVASANYNNMSDWFYGDNVATVFNDAITDVGGDGAPIVNTDEPYLAQSSAPNLDSQSGTQDISTGVNTNYYRFYRDTSSSGTNQNRLYLLITGTQRCGGVASRDKRRSSVTAEIQVYRAESVVTFETIPQDAAPNIWYENHLSFPIDEDGHHQGNIQNQTDTVSAIVDTEFANVYAFGNGVESYKILDSIVGKTLNYGERTTSTSTQEYKEAHRTADITYSGVYNDETNVNKLNEFNLGLANFKSLEEIFGSIQKLHSRKSDVLVLQEDKISYVLAGKNLLSDASGGGALTSVPEVLGTQITRIEEYGISKNPESFAAWGKNKYFTDAKRGVVLNLIGSSAQNEQLEIVSQYGMRSWFRDLFIEAFDTEKLGGYDPYMNEYVLATTLSTETLLADCVNCGINKFITLEPGVAFNYCVELTEFLGQTEIKYTIPFEGTDDILSESSDLVITELNSNQQVSESALSGTGYVITAVYDGATYSTGTVYQSGVLTFSKNSVSATTVDITITTDSLTSDTIQVDVECPQSEVINIYNVAVTSNSDAEKYITNEYRWSAGNYVSPLHSERVEFSTSTINPVVSQYTLIAGKEGGGVIPGSNATVSIISRKESFDNFNFNINGNKLKYLRTDTLFENNSASIDSLLLQANDATPIISQSNPEQFYAEFSMPASGQNLYLIWDYRESSSASLCYSNTGLADACTGCTPIPTPTPVAPTPSPTFYAWPIENNGSITSPASCPLTGTYVYAAVANYSDVFANSTVFYSDQLLQVPFQGNDRYFGVRNANSGTGLSSGIFRMTNQGTVSNIDLTGVCNTSPTPTGTEVWDLQLCSGGAANLQVYDDGLLNTGMVIGYNGNCYTVLTKTTSISGQPFSIYTEYTDCTECIPGVYYYELRQCTTGSLTDVEITQSLNIGQALVWNNQCWTVNAIASGGQQISPSSFHANCNTCP
jgi:hypothetical protein